MPIDLSMPSAAALKLFFYLLGRHRSPQIDLYYSVKNGLLMKAECSHKRHRKLMHRPSNSTTTTDVL